MGTGKSAPVEGSPPEGNGGTAPVSPRAAALPHPDHVVGLENFGNTCYCNSVLQVLYQCRTVRASVLSHRKRSKDDTHNLLTRLAQLFASMDSAKRKSVVTPTQFVQMVRKMRVEYQGPQHQDAPEFLMYILNDIMELEKRARGPIPPSQAPPKTFVEDVFQGTQVTQMTCLGCDSGSDRKETFLQLSVEILPNTSLTHCLKNYCRTESLSGPNKLKCESCSGFAEGRLRLQLADMPKVLVIQLKRFRYCEVIQGYKKLSYRVAFPTSTLVSGGKEYHLRGVVVHQGSSTNVGHYFSCVKTPAGQWWLLDDEVCSKIEEADVHAYFGHSGAAVDAPVRRSSVAVGVTPPGGMSVSPQPSNQITSLPSSATTAYLLLYEC